MINYRIIFQSHLIYFRKTCYIVHNLKKKSKPSPPLLNPQSKHTLKNFLVKNFKAETQVPYIPQTLHIHKPLMQ